MKIRVTPETSVSIRGFLLQGFSLLLLLAAAPAWAADRQTARSAIGDRKDVTITVYNSDLGLVREVRSVTAPAGEVSLEFEDVPSKIDATSVSFVSDGVQVLEQNYEFDLLSQQKLMDKFVGRDVELHVTETVKDVPQEKVVKARLVANNERQPIYLIDGQIHLGFPGRVVLPDLPANLRARPTLVYLLNVEKAGPRDASVTYQTAGMNWNCDYVAIINKTDDRLVLLTGWVTLNNQSGASFENAGLKLIAGDVHRAAAPEQMRYKRERSVPMAMPQKSSAGFEEKSFFEYHLYTLQRRTDLKDNSSKQVELMTAADIPVKKVLVVDPIEANPWGWWSAARNDERKEKIKVMLEFKNDTASRLGMPLPKGRIRVNKEDEEGSLLFIGEDNVDHTPKDEMIRVQMGEAFDVAADRRQTDYQIVRDDPRVVETEFELEIRNHKPADIEVRVVERFPAFNEITLLKHTHPFKKRSAHIYEFTVPVKANGTEKLTYRAKAEF